MGNNFRFQLLYFNLFTGTASLQSAGASYASTRLLNLESSDLNCGLHNLYKIQEIFYNLFHLSEVYNFVPKVSSKYFVQNPLKYLNNHTIPQVLKIKASMLGIVLKNELSCLMESLDASSDLLR